MNTLIINISLRPTSNTKFLPVGLGYIATAIKNAGFEFDLLDIDAYRLSDEEVERKISSKIYDIACMGCVVTGYKTVKYLSQIIKKYSPNCKIIVGNSVATSIVDTLLNKTQADIAVIGEGDCTIVELLRSIENQSSLSNISGICFKQDDKIFKNSSRPVIKDVSALPFIDYSIFDIEKYVAASKYNECETRVKIPDVRILPINTARGCINKCTFCYHVFRDLGYRFRNPKSIVGEIKLLINKYSINYIQFWDELTFFNKSQAESLVDEMIKENVNIYWTGHCRANLFTDEKDLKIMEKMRKSGCIGMEYSLESSDENILKAMNKNISKEQFSKQTELYKKADIVPWTSLIIGYPQETKETIKNTFDFCIKCGIFPSAGFLLPQPGSPIYQYAIDNGFIRDEEEYLLALGDRQDLRINMTKLSDQELEDGVAEGLRKCNIELKVGLDNGTQSLIKTGSYKIAK